MSLGNKKTVEEVRIVDIEKRERFRIQVVEETLSDDSKAYNVVTSFYENGGIAPVLTLEDASACNFNEAWKQFEATKRALFVFEEFQTI